jgi:arsenical pump membrane protein
MSNSFVDLLVLYGSWIMSLGFIILGVVINFRPSQLWKQPQIFAPLLSVCVLLQYGHLNLTDIYEVVSDKASILILILSFAYIAISLDDSGFFDYCATVIVNKSRNNGVKLFLNLFILVSLLTLFTSNDIVILTMTPIIIYVCRNAGIKDMLPFLISQFFAANILSMGLYVGSPTNIVIGATIGWTFLYYALWMILPSIVCGAMALGLTYVVFVKMGKNRVPNRLKNIRKSGAPNFNYQMKLKVSIFASLLICLALTSLEELRIKIWVVCLIFAFVAFLVDFLVISRNRIEKRIFFFKVSQRMPWSIVPFAVSFFCIIEALSKVGFPILVGNKMLSLVHMAGDGSGMFSRLIGAVTFGGVSALLVNIMNDIPATVFLSEILARLQSVLADQPGLFHVLATSTLVGVNPGCSMSIIGALAGLMWMEIMTPYKQDGEIFPSPKALSLYGIPIMLIVVACGSLVCWLETIIVF